MATPGWSADDDLAAIAATPMARVAGGVLGAAGLFSGVLALQSWLLIVRAPLYVFVPVAAMTLCAAGSKVLRMYGWAALAGAGAAGFMALVASGWAVFALLHGVVSLLALLVVPLTLAACMLCILCIARGRLADAARARLREQGLEAGL